MLKLCSEGLLSLKQVSKGFGVNTMDPLAIGESLFFKNCCGLNFEKYIGSYYR